MLHCKVIAGNKAQYVRTFQGLVEMYQLLMYSKSNGGQYTKNATAQPNGVWEGNIHFLPNFRFFAAILRFFKIFTHFQMAKKEGNLDRQLFPASPCIRVNFFLQKKTTKKEKLILGAKTRFCGNSHLFEIL